MTQPPPEPGRRATEHPDAYRAIYDDPEFAELRRRFRRLVLPLTAGFLAWYFVYVLLATYARDFMAHEVSGRINVGLLLGLGQFVSTFAIAWYYARRAERDIDPLSERLHARFDGLAAERGAPDTREGGR